MGARQESRVGDRWEVETWEGAEAVGLPPAPLNPMPASICREGSVFHPYTMNLPTDPRITLKPERESSVARSQ